MTQSQVCFFDKIFDDLDKEGSYSDWKEIIGDSDSQLQTNIRHQVLQGQSMPDLQLQLL
jgi:hypothetical protein